MTAGFHHTRWQTSRLADCVDAVSTGPFGSLLHKDDYVRDGTPVINPINLRDGQIIHNPVVTVADALAKQLNSYRVRAGDILVARRGDIGRCGLVLPSQDGWICGTGCFVIRTGQAVDPQFLTLLLGSPIYRTALEAVSTGTTMLNLSNKALSNLIISLPPLEEQKRIVAVLDQAFAALDRARALAEANLADAEELFRVQREAMFDGAEKGWPSTTIGAVCDRFEYGTSAKSQPTGSVPVLRMGNLQAGRLDWSDLVFTDRADDIRKLSLEPGDILFNRTNSVDHVGKTAIYRGEQPAIFAGYLIRLHRKEALIDAEFLNLYLNSDRARDYGRSVMGKSVNQANISASKLAFYPIDLPTLDEQAEIAQTLNMLSDQVDNVRAKYRTKLQSIDELRQSLLHKAFAGELT